MIFGPICDVLPPAQRNVDVLLQYFVDMFVMSVLSKMWTFRSMIFGPICDVLPPARRNVEVLS
jgi:hypothetical protein